MGETAGFGSAAGEAAGRIDAGALAGIETRAPRPAVACRAFTLPQSNTGRKSAEWPASELQGSLMAINVGLGDSK
jgi:hypothetical protein